MTGERKTVINLGGKSREEWDRIIREASRIPDPGMRIEAVSREFLGIPYVGFTLIGDSEGGETPVINLAGVDCFTFLDYVEAMRISRSFESFLKNVAVIRYKGGQPLYEGRNHFFSDWVETNSAFVRDVTEETGGNVSRRVRKHLNLRGDGGLYVAGMGVTARDISYIPGDRIDDDVRARLGTGDYIGIYGEDQGLDVTHVGIVIRKEGGLYFRHASSDQRVRKVVDQDFAAYTTPRPGIVVYRPVDGSVAL